MGASNTRTDKHSYATEKTVSKHVMNQLLSISPFASWSPSPLPTLPTVSRSPPLWRNTHHTPRNGSSNDCSPSCQVAFEKRFIPARGVIISWGDEKQKKRKTNISPDSEWGWRCASYSGVRRQVWNVEGTGGFQGPHHWGCAAPGCSSGWGTYSFFTVLQWVSDTGLDEEVWRKGLRQTVHCIKYVT